MLPEAAASDSESHSDSEVPFRASPSARAMKHRSRSPSPSRPYNVKESLPPVNFTLAITFAVAFALAAACLAALLRVVGQEEGPVVQKDAVVPAGTVAPIESFQDALVAGWTGTDPTNTPFMVTVGLLLGAIYGGFIAEV